MSDPVTQFIQSFSDEAKILRRQFHQIPETGWTEYLTTWRIYEFFQSLNTGFDVVLGRELIDADTRLGVADTEELKAARERLVCAGADPSFVELVDGGFTGLMAVYDTGNPGPDTVFRFDIDGLPITESTSSQHKPAKEGFASKITGCMHACGHDNHIAIGLGLAKFIEKNGTLLKGKIRLLFQPAEEGCRGAHAVVQKGWMQGVDYLISGHVGIEQRPVGSVSVKALEMLATSKLDVEFSGRAAHAGNNPEDGQNALIAAANSALGLHGISRHAAGSSRVNVGSLVAGSGRNIIADKASMMVELRGENNEIHDYMYDRALEVIAGAALMNGVKQSVEIVGKAVAGVCDDALAEQLMIAICDSPKIKEVWPELYLKASEDVTTLMNAVQTQGGKATYFIFCSPTKGGHHHCEFDIDEGVLDVGIGALTRSLLSINS